MSEKGSHESKVLIGEGAYVGHGRLMSNNVAEYSGFCAAVEFILKNNLCPEAVIIRGDSKLVIYQLSPDPRIGKKWKVNGGLYFPYYQKAKQLLAKLEECTGGVVLEWIPRDKNSDCDFYSKEVLRMMGIRFRIQPEGK
jgi:ribonuclease HI